ncbi:hypothetical protein GCM10009797_36630 [Nocardioides hwasunensis]
MHDQVGRRDVEGVVGERQLLGRRPAYVDARVALAACLDERCRRVGRRDPVGPQPIDQDARQGARTAADVDRPGTRSETEPVGEDDRERT